MVVDALAPGIVRLSAVIIQHHKTQLPWIILIRNERPSPSWWLQMAWRKMGTRPSAATMLFLLWLQTMINYITHVTQNAYIALQTLNKIHSRQVWRLAIRWFLCSWRVCLITNIMPYANIWDFDGWRPSNGLVSSGNKPLLESMLTQIKIAIGSH